MDAFRYEYQIYENFSAEHFGALIAFVGVLILLIYRGKQMEQKQKTSLFLWIAVIPFIGLLLRMMLDHSHRGLNLQDDLPLHLCRILALIAPMVAYFNNSKFTAIYIYISLAGTLNAMITADPGFGFPHYEYFLYWIYHGGILGVAFFAWIVMRVRLTIKAAWQALVAVNIYFILVHLINIRLLSNYLYSRHKPPVNTLMDYLGEWPVYLIWLEVIALVFLAVIYLIQKLILDPPDKKI